jgi:hypothetical protein
VTVIIDEQHPTLSVESLSSFPLNASSLTPQQAYRVRVLDSEKYNQTQNLADGAKDFCDKVSQLNDIVKSVVEAVDQQVRG